MDDDSAAVPDVFAHNERNQDVTYRGVNELGNKGFQDVSTLLAGEGVMSFVADQLPDEFRLVNHQFLLNSQLTNVTKIATTIIVEILINILALLLPYSSIFISHLFLA